MSMLLKKLEQTITTLEIAEMMEMRHSDILEKLEGSRKVKGIIPVLAERNFPLSDYFKESNYKDLSGKENKCYEVTKLGCDFLANKFTGEKGIILHAKSLNTDKAWEVYDTLVETYFKKVNIPLGDFFTENHLVPSDY